jgi:hypothetical protein
MNSATIKVEKPENLRAVVARLKNDAKRYNVFFEGGNYSGRGSGYGFDGTYVVDGNFITIDVRKKPVFITKTRVEKEIRKYLSKQEDAG